MKLLIHAIDGVGLGHLVRTLEIAKALKLQRKDAQIVFVTNSPFPVPILREGFKVYQLKYHTKTVIEGRMSYDAYLRVNYLRIKALVKKERPDIVLMDSEFNAPLVDFCCENKIKTCFVLRSTTDDNFNSFCQKGSLDKLSLVLVPHHAEEISPMQRDVLAKSRNVHFVGPILRSVEKMRAPVKDKALRILITFAAGSNVPAHKELFLKVSEFLDRLKEKKMRIGGKKAIVTIVTGPLFEEGACDFHGFKYKKFEDNLPGLMARSDLVLSPAGYNSINEIIFTKTPALLIPVARKVEDQYLRAKSLEDKGCAVIIRSGVWEVLKLLIEEQKLEKMRLAFPEMVKGNTRAAGRLIELAEEKPEVLFLKGCWLSLSERFIYDEISCLERYRPIVLCLSRKENFTQKCEVLCDEKFSCLWNKDYPLVLQENKELYDQMLQWVESEIKTRGIKILHAGFLSDAIFFLPLKRLLGLPMVVSVRGHDLYAKKPVDLACVFAEADMFLARSEMMRTDLIREGCPPEKIFVQHSGIKLPGRAPLKRRLLKETRLVMVGRLVEKKGTVFGVDLFNKLCERFGNLKLYIIGDGPQKDAVRAAAIQSPFAGKITCCGSWPNDKVLKLMGQCHILLHPSQTASDGDKEGVPGVIMEAIAQGLLVVASDNGSIGELVEHNKTGIVFKQTDMRDALAKTGFAIKNLARLQAVKNRAFKKVEAEFDVVDQTVKLETLYNSVLKNDRRRNYEKFYRNYETFIDSGSPSFFRADIHPVRGCNSFCVMCDHWKQKKSEFLSKEQIFDTIKELKNIGTREIRFHGHEPTLREDLLELIDYAKGLGIWVGLKSNCLDLSPDYCKRLARLDKLYVSIDSPIESMHNKMRGHPDSFKENLKVISIVRAQNPSIVIDANSVVTRLNYQTLAGMPQFAKKAGISKVSFVLLNTKNKREIANLLPKSDQVREFYFRIVPEIIRGCMAHAIAFDFSPFFADLVLENPHKILRELTEHPEKFEEEINNYVVMDYGKTFYKRYGCHGPVDHLSINYDGNVYPCCVVERIEANAMGNLTASGFKQVWGSEKYRAIRNDTVISRGTCCVHSATCASNFGSRKYLSQRISLAPELKESVHD